MHLSLSPEHYRLLVKYLKVADWVISNTNTTEDADMAEKDMLQEIYKQAATFGAEELFVKEESLALLDVNEDLEDAVLEQVIDPYVNEMFWENLVMRLAVRDMADYPELAPGPVDAAPSEEFMQQVAMLEQEYQREFARHGLERFMLVTDEDEQEEEGHHHHHHHEDGSCCHHNHG